MFFKDSSYEISPLLSWICFLSSSINLSAAFNFFFCFFIFALASSGLNSAAAEAVTEEAEKDTSWMLDVSSEDEFEDRRGDVSWC